MKPDTSVTWTDPDRARRFGDWLASLPPALGLDAASLRPASADASFRRYLRIDGAAGSRVVMDAPPVHEDCRPFVRVAALLRNAGLNAPDVLHWDEPNGFMLLSDLGSTTYLTALQTPEPMSAAQAAPLYMAAVDALVKLQGIDAQAQVPAYDRALLQREMQLFPEWYVERHCGHSLDDAARQRLETSFGHILDVCTAQPNVLVHRDYHARNLMWSPPHPPGLLDFQDAVWGPISYDLVSLLRDAYVEWDEEVQIDWAVRWWERARKAGLPVDADFGAFWRDFEWMGLQRQLKVLGIFARLYHRDGKDGYLKDLPRVWRYAHRVACRYSVLTPLARLLEDLSGTQREDGYTF